MFQPELIEKYGYPMELHTVTTEDGYILEMHRIPHGRDRDNSPGPRPVVFLMHGLLSSSADWVVTGPGCAFGNFLLILRLTYIHTYVPLTLYPRRGSRGISDIDTY
jgi:hypothetical protein